MNAREGRDVDLMCDKHQRRIQRVVSQPGFKFPRLPVSPFRFLEEGIENRRFNHRAEPQQFRRFNTAAPLA